MNLFLALLCYLLGMLAAAAGSRLAGRCLTWCCALVGFPMWVVNGTAVCLCVGLPQLMLAFLAAGMDATALAVGSALAGAAADLGLVFAACLLRRGGAMADRKEFLHKGMFLVLACAVVLVFVRGGTLSHTGCGLLMLLFSLFLLDNMICQYRFACNEDISLLGTDDIPPETLRQTADATRHDTMQFPAMGIRSSLANLGGVVLGTAVLAAGSLALVASAVFFANRTGTIQAVWAATLISLGFRLPLLAEVFRHPLGSVWKRFAVKTRIFPEPALPIQVLSNAVLSITLVLPLSNLMYRDRLPVGAQFRHYDGPACIVMALVLLLPVLAGKPLSRKQGWVCLALYGIYLLAVLLAPLAGA